MLESVIRWAQRSTQWLAESLTAQPSRGNDLAGRELRLLDILSCEARSGMTGVVARQRLPVLRERASSDQRNALLCDAFIQSVRWSRRRTANRL